MAMAVHGARQQDVKVVYYALIAPACVVLEDIVTVSSEIGGCTFAYGDID